MGDDSAASTHLRDQRIGHPAPVEPASRRSRMAARVARSGWRKSIRPAAARRQGCAALAGNRWSRAVSSAIEALRYSSMRNPSRASRIAGSMRVFQGELTEPAVGFREARDAAGYSRGEVTGVALSVPAVGTDEHGGRRGAGAIPGNRGRAPGRCRAEEQEPAAAKVSRLRMDHGKGERHRHGGVDRVAALPQDIAADLARQGMAGHHHGAGRVGDARAAEQRPVEWNAGGVLLAGERCGRGDSAGKKQN